MTDFQFFAAACLVFEQDKSHTDAREWPERLTGALLAMPSVEDVEVLVSSNELECLTPPDSWPADALPYELPFWPEPGAGHVSFKIRIPTRLQPDILSGRDAGAEHFAVKTYYDWHGPYTFVSALDGNIKKTRPSSGVVAVREFLKRELPKVDDSISLSTIGPSPFHMDAILTAMDAPQADTPPTPLKFRHIGNSGYDQYRFLYDPALFSSIDQAQESLHRALGIELGPFYALTRRSTARRHRATEVANRSAALIKAHQEAGAGANFYRLFRSGGEARRLGLYALQAKLVAADDEQFAKECIETASAQSSSLNALTKQLARAANDDTVAYLANALETIGLAEGSRSKDFEVAILAASTLLGGVAGAIAATVAS